MTDAQIIAIAITVLAVLCGALINNTRITDVKEVIRAEVQRDFAQFDLKMDGRFNSIDTRFNAMEGRFNSIDRKLDEILRIVGDHDVRIAALEQRPH